MNNEYASQKPESPGGIQISYMFLNKIMRLVLASYFIDGNLNTKQAQLNNIIKKINKSEDGKHIIKKGVDQKKDQSYVLWGIPKETISKTILPLGELTKEEVRQIARNNNLETADEPESMEICFIADNNYKRFINEYASDKIKNINSGKTLNEEGKQIGENSGYVNYTIGQRKGIGLSNPEPLYVKNIDSIKNTITVSDKKSLFSSKCKISNINWLVKQPTFPLNAKCQIRYNGNGAEAVIDKNDNIHSVNFNEPQLAITPGQSIVFYNNNILLGGGIIEPA